MGESSQQARTPPKTGTPHGNIKMQRLAADQDLPIDLRLSFNLQGRDGESDASGDSNPPLEDPYFLPEMDLEKITIGVELEMILVNTWGADAFGLVRKSLQDLADNLNTSVPPLKTFMQKKQNTPTQDPFTVFQVKTDQTISCTYWEKRGISTTAVEVATPILRNGTWTWVIPAMCQALASLATPSIGIQTAFNSSTGLHVHIGLGRPYALAELKRIAKAIVLFEKQLDSCHPKCRIPEDDLGSCFRSCRRSPALRGLTNAEMVAVIGRCVNTEDLLCVINGLGRDRYQRFYKYNFLPVQTYGSIEFRQAMGTSNGSWIVGWIAIVVKFVAMAVETGDETYAEWAKMGDVPPGVCHLFGVPSPVGYGKGSREKKRERSVPMVKRLSRGTKHVYLSKQGVRGG